MATVASLFGSQAEATEALDALAESEFADVDTRVFEQVGTSPGEPEVGALPHLTNGRLSGAMDPGTSEWFDGLSEEYFAARCQSMPARPKIVSA